MEDEVFLCEVVRRAWADHLTAQRLAGEARDKATKAYENAEAAFAKWRDARRDLLKELTGETDPY